MIEFVLHDDVADDLRRIRVRSSAAEKRILAVLEAAEGDAVLLRNLQAGHYRTYGSADTDVKRWVLARQLGFEIHRLRAFYIEEYGFNYRVIYALDESNGYCYVLAIAHREEIDYDDATHPLNQRIFSAYQSLGL